MAAKLTVTCLLAVFLIGLENAMAQDNRSNYSEQRLKLQAEMMALDMAERYGLDEKQVKKLTEANLIWLQERGNGSWLYDSPCYDYRHRRRTDYRHRRRGCCGNLRYEDYCCEAYCTDGHHAYDCHYYDARNAYDEILRKIMTKEQYNAFQEQQTEMYP